LKARNAELPDHRKMEFRIGINLGDVIVDGERIYGDGVNIAARVEGLADGGGICISGSAHEQIEGKLALGYEYLGEHDVKNIEKPVRVYRVRMEPGATAPGARRARSPRLRHWQRAGLAVVVVLVVGAGAVALWNFYLRPSPPPAEVAFKEKTALPLPDKYRIAVLPFANISRDAEDEYFADGMTEELISRLSKIGELSVLARTSVMKYKGTDTDIADIGRALHVGTILEGSVRKAANQVRITVQLIDVPSQAHLWSEDYDREFKGIFAIQSDIGQRVAEALQVELLTGEKEQIEEQGTANLEAYTWYLKGRYFLNQRTKEALEKGKAYFEQALDKDPTYALAYAGLADFYNVIPMVSNVRPQEAYPRAKAAAEKALALDDTLAEAHVALANGTLRHYWDWAGGERALERAIQLNPSYAEAHRNYGHYVLSPKGRREEAIAELKRAQELDPLSLATNKSLGWVLIHARQYDRSIAQFRKTLDTWPNSLWSHIGLGLNYQLKGMYEEAIAAYQKAVDVSGGYTGAVGYVGWAYALAGRRDEALKVLEALQERAQQEPVDPLAFTYIYMGLGEEDQAFTWLHKAYEKRSVEMFFLFNPKWDSLRSDPRFTDLVKKVGLPVE
ncbi:MAG: tetratricopeptide repeat protein, partial [Candidatus Methylomirabilales bacterium]